MDDLGAIDWDNPVSDNDLNRGLVGWWLPGVDAPYWGTRTLRDLVPKGAGVGGSHGTATTGAGWTRGPNGFGAIVTIATDDLDAKYIVPGPTLTGNLTASCWVYPQTQYLWSSVANWWGFYDSAFGNAGWGFGQASDRLSNGLLYVRTEATTKSFSAAWTLNVWQHMAVRITPPDATLFINGVPFASVTDLPAISAGVQSKVIGGSNVGSAASTHTGYSTDYALHNRGLTDAEMMAWYQQSLRGHPDTLRRLSRRTWFVPAAGGDITVNLGLCTETDSLLALTRRKSRSVGLNAESDASLTLTRSKSKLLGLVAESDTSLSPARFKAKSIGLNAESDSPLAANATRVYPAGLTTETDATLAATRYKARILGLSTETDVALAALAGRVYTAGLTTETDSALARAGLFKTRTLGLNTETDSLLSLGPEKQYPVTFPSESDSSLSPSRRKSRSIGLLSEADTSLALSLFKVLTLGLNSESDSPFAVSGRKARSVSLVSESDTSLPLGSEIQVLLDLAAEFDTALSASHRKSRLLGLSQTQDDSLGLSSSKALPLGLVLEAVTALGLQGRVKTCPIGLSSAAEVALAVARRKLRLLGIAAEADAALACTASLAILVIAYSFVQAARGITFTQPSRGVSFPQLARV